MFCMKRRLSAEVLPARHWCLLISDLASAIAHCCLLLCAPGRFSAAYGLSETSRGQ